MKLIHYSSEPLTALTDPREFPGARIGKPHRGLWVSAEAQPFDPGDEERDGDWGWRQWCEAEKFSLERLTHATEIILKPDANPMWLKTAAAVEDLASEYPRETGHVRGTFVPRFDNIDWDAIMSNWPAIIIAPYQWRCRMDVMWYYCWDCASGVIWDLSIIEAIRPAPEFARPKEEAALGDDKP